MSLCVPESKVVTDSDTQWLSVSVTESHIELSSHYVWTAKNDLTWWIDPPMFKITVPPARLLSAAGKERILLPVNVSLNVWWPSWLPNQMFSLILIFGFLCRYPDDYVPVMAVLFISFKAYIAMDSSFNLMGGGKGEVSVSSEPKKTCEPACRQKAFVLKTS